MLSFGTVVAANNLTALKDFNTFLFNMEIHERPGFLERKLIAWAKVWVANRAVKQLKDLQAEIDSNTLGIGINDCSTAMFSVLHLACQQITGRFKLKTGQEIFSCLAQIQLEFEKIKKTLAAPNKANINYDVDQ